MAFLRKRISAQVMDSDVLSLGRRLMPLIDSPQNSFQATDDRRPTNEAAGSRSLQAADARSDVELTNPISSKRQIALVRPS